MAVVQIIQIGFPVGHAADNSRRKLAGCSFNSDFSIVKEGEIRSTHSGIFIFSLNELDIEEAQGCDRRADFASNIFFFREKDQDLEKLLIDSTDLVSH